MSFAELQILLHFFFLAGIILSLTVRKGRAKAKNSGKKKLLFYYLIVQLIFLSMLNQISIAILASVIVLMGARELLRLKIAALLWISYIIISLSFVLFSTMVPLDTIRMVYLVVVIFDYFSEVGGQVWGRKALLPVISPGKTVQGLITGIVSIQVLIWILNCFSLASRHVIILNVFWFAAFIGDLLASKIKRMNRIKDFDQLLPAQGGILDRFDSFLLAGAACYVLFEFGLLT